MTAISTSAHVAIGKPALSDIAPAFNLIQAGSAQGCFCNLYLQPRYQAGLALQLFSVFFLGKIRLPDGTWFKAELSIIRVADRFAGFALVRTLSPLHRELYMCGVEPGLQGRGHGRALLEKTLADLPPGGTLETECLDAAVMMRALVGKLGFERIMESAPQAGGAWKFRYIAPQR
jgi:ribosomal protein S18 acetylase RimI-like enzyme